MGTITTSKDTSINLTTNIAKGKLSYDNLLSWVNDYYAGRITKYILWDLTEADLSKIKIEEFRKLAEVIKRNSGMRKGGKTALVFKRDLEYGLGRMFEVFSEMQDIKFEFMSFRDVEKAKKWLGI